MERHYVVDCRLILYDGVGPERRNKNARATVRKFEIEFDSLPLNLQDTLKMERDKVTKLLGESLIRRGCLQDNIRYRVKILGYKRVSEN